MPGSNGNGQAEAYGVASRIAAGSGSSGSSGFSDPWWSGPLADGISGVFNTINAWVNRRFQERMMDQQRQWQLEDWNRQNNYNAPSAVMARMASAGLNPDLLTGGNSSNATVPAQGPAPSGSQAHPMSMLGTQAAVQALLGNRLTESQISLNKAQADNIEADAERKKRENDMDIGGVNVRKILHDMSSRDFQLSIERELADSNISLNKEQRILIINQAKDAFLQYLMSKQRKDQYGQELSDYHELRSSESARNRAEAALAGSRKKYTDKDVDILENTYQYLDRTLESRVNEELNDSHISDEEASVASPQAVADIARAHADYEIARVQSGDSLPSWDYVFREYIHANGGVLYSPNSGRRGSRSSKRSAKPGRNPMSVRQGMDYFGNRNTPYGKWKSTGGNY